MKYFSFCIFLSANLIFYDLNSNKFEKKEFFQNLKKNILHFLFTFFNLKIFFS